MKTYRKTATVTARLFKKGDEDGFEGFAPYITTLESQKYIGKFGAHYICYGVQGEKWLVDKDIFERTYEEV
ncbi:MAG: hypothetical protein GY928_22195 [Colwellia sp.]|nr:hypothetical protein [Colwellia sp.]